MGGNLVTFEELLDKLTQVDDGWSVSIFENWAQGRTLYGGLSLGLSLAVAIKEYPDLPPLRSATISFIGPVNETPIFTATLLRRGKNVAFVQVNIHVCDKLMGTCMFTFGVGLTSDLSTTIGAPKHCAPEDAQPYLPKSLQKFMPAFTRNFDMKLITGSRPMSGAKEGYVRGWFRHKDEQSRTGMESFLACADIVPPASIPMFKKIGPISTMNWTMNILNNADTTDGWWHIESRLSAASAGYTSEITRYWNRSGLLVAEGIQSVAIFI